MKQWKLYVNMYMNKNKITFCIDYDAPSDIVLDI